MCRDVIVAVQVSEPRPIMAPIGEKITPVLVPKGCDQGCGDRSKTPDIASSAQNCPIDHHSDVLPIGPITNTINSLQMFPENHVCFSPCARVYPAGRE